MENALRTSDCPLYNMASFIYLGHLLTTTDKDWTVVVFNLRKTQMNWAHMSWYLGWEGEDVQTSVIFLKDVI